MKTFVYRNFVLPDFTDPETAKQAWLDERKAVRNKIIQKMEIEEELDNIISQMSIDEYKKTFVEENQGR